MTGSNPNGRSKSPLQQPRPEHRNGSGMPSGMTGSGLPEECESHPGVSSIRIIQGGRGYLKIIVLATLAGLVILEMPPLSLSFSRDDPILLFSLKGYGPVRLQRADSLNNPNWLDLANMDETNTIPVPTTGKAGFFRVVRP